MGATDETIFDPADLAFHFDRLTLSLLPEPQRRQWEELAEWIEGHWPVEDLPTEDAFDAEDETRSKLLDELCEKLAGEGVESIAATTPDELVEAIVERMKGDALLEGVYRAVSEAMGVEHLSVESALERLEAERAEGEKDATIPSRANTAQRKAMRLLLEQRLTVRQVVAEGERAGFVLAECKGDSGDTYMLGRDPRNGQWRCTCAELKGGCSHIAALKMVTPS